MKLSVKLGKHGVKSLPVLAQFRGWDQDYGTTKKSMPQTQITSLTSCYVSCPRVEVQNQGRAKNELHIMWSSSSFDFPISHKLLFVFSSCHCFLLP
jgi:hypothetical protein